MLACTMTKYEFIIPAENINGYTWNEDYQKVIQNLFKSAYGVIKVKLLIFGSLMYLRNLSSQVINS